MKFGVKVYFLLSRFSLHSVRLWTPENVDLASFDVDFNSSADVKERSGRREGNGFPACF